MDVMDVEDWEVGDRASNRAVLKIQQQFLDHREKTSQKLQKLEATIKLAQQKMQELIALENQSTGEGFVPFGWKQPKKDSCSKSQMRKDSESLQHLKLKCPKFVEGKAVEDWLQDCEHHLVVEHHLAVEPLYDEGPIYDEEPRENQEFWPAKEFILAALNKDDSDTPNPLQSEICTSKRLEELAESSNIQESDLQQKNVPPGTEFSLTWSAFECSSSKTESLGMDTHLDMDQNHQISPSKMFTEVSKMPAGNNSNEKFEMKGHSPFINENGIYNSLGNPSEIGMSTNEVAYDLQPVLMAAYASSLEFDDFYSPVHCSPRELKWLEVGQSYNMKLMSKDAHVHGGKSNYKGEDVDYQGEEKQTLMEEASLMNFTNIREVVKAFPCKMTSRHFPESATPYDLGMFRHGEKQDEVVIISTYDILGQPPDMIGLKFLTIKEHPRLKYKVSKVQMVTSMVGDETDRVVCEINQQYAQSLKAGMEMILRYLVMRYGFSKVDGAMILEDQISSEESVTIYIFDPGGDLSCLYEFQWLVTLLVLG